MRVRPTVKKVRLWILLALLAITAALLVCLRAGCADWLLSLLRLTDLVWEKPPAFGAFHLAWFLVCVVLAVLCAVIGSRSGAKHTDSVLFGFGVAFLILEVYKQLYSFYVIQDRVYDFGFFPFQFCSLPLYLCLLLPFLPSGRTRHALLSFLVLFETMGGCLVMTYPAFYDRLALCIHTMLWHTLMICLGCFLLFSCGFGKSWRREVLPAIPVFLVSLTLATVLNVALHPIAQNSPNPLNLYYISPYGNTHFIVVGDVRRLLGWAPALLTYAILFIFVGATLVFGVTFLARYAASLSSSRKKQEK